MTIDGIRMSYGDEGKGLPLVFVHGFPLSRRCWQPQVDGLASSSRIITPDLRGFGESEASSGMVTMDRFADDVAALLEALGTGPAVLVGHSMGGYVALAFARRHVESLRGLVLVATRAGRDAPEAAAGRRTTAENVRAEGIQGVIDGMTPKMLAPGNTDARMLEDVSSLMTPASREGVIGALLGMAERPDSTASLTDISVPTFVVTGDEDSIIDPAESEAMANAIPGGLLQVIPDAGHMVAYEQAGVFNRELGEWLQSAVL